MTWEQYWYGDVWMVEAFREKDKLEQKNMDTKAWLNGLYVLKALYASVGNMFRDKNKSEQINYPEIPIFVEQQRVKTEEEKEREVQNERLRAYAQFDLLVRLNKERRGEE